jgi:hypothetical protein
MEESQTLHGREEYRLYSFYLHRSHHWPIKLNAVRDDYSQSVQYSQDHRETRDADVTYLCGVNDLTIWEVYGERVHC